MKEKYHFQEIILNNIFFQFCKISKDFLREEKLISEAAEISHSCFSLKLKEIF